MDIKDFLSLADVAIDVQVSDKNEVLRILTDRLTRPRNLPRAVIVAALLKRERLGSTGTGSGVAIPHARIPIVEKVTGFLVRLDRAIEFGAIEIRRWISYSLCCFRQILKRSSFTRSRALRES